jgi:hypothetical protein
VFARDACPVNFHGSQGKQIDKEMISTILDPSNLIAEQDGDSPSSSVRTMTVGFGIAPNLLTFFSIY